MQRLLVWSNCIMKEIKSKPMTRARVTPWTDVCLGWFVRRRSPNDERVAYPPTDVTASAISDGSSQVVYLPDNAEKGREIRNPQ